MLQVLYSLMHIVVSSVTTSSVACSIINPAIIIQYHSILNGVPLDSIKTPSVAPPLAQKQPSSSSSNSVNILFESLSDVSLPLNNPPSTSI